MVASLGEDSGYVPYTAFSAKKGYIEAHPDVIQSFTNALQKGMDYVKSHTPEEIAAAIQPQFEETDKETITTIVTRYYDQDTWEDNLVFDETPSPCCRISWRNPASFPRGFPIPTW